MGRGVVLVTASVGGNNTLWLCYCNQPVFWFKREVSRRGEDGGCLVVGLGGGG